MEQEDRLRIEIKRDLLSLQLRQEQLQASSLAQENKVLQCRYDRVQKTFDSCKKELAINIHKALSPRLALDAVNYRVGILRSASQASKQAKENVIHSNTKVSCAQKRILQSQAKVDALSQGLACIKKSQAKRLENRSSEYLSELHSLTKKKATSKVREKNDCRTESGREISHPSILLGNENTISQTTNTALLLAAQQFSTYSQRADASNSQQHSSDQKPSPDHMHRSHSDQSNEASALSFSDRIKELHSWERLAEKGVEFSYQTDTGSNVSITMKSDADKGISVSLGTNSTIDQRALALHKNTLEQALHKAGVNVHTITVRQELSKGSAR